MEKEKVALYGLGTETERYISTHGEAMSIVGLLDGFRTSGELYGYPIFSLEEAIAQGIAQIIVVARPGSCKVIAKRIGEQCRESGIALFDVRGNDLLLERKVSYDLNHVQRETKALLLDKIARAEVVSFDLFDTLIMRKFMEYTDVFAAVDVKLQEQGIIIKDFAKVRLAAEKELSRMGAPTLEKIYEEILKQSQGCPFSAEQLAELEWQTDTMSFVTREEMCVLVVVVLGVYLALNLRENNGKNKENVQNTEAQNILSKNLDHNYPATVREVVRLYSRISQCYHNETISDEEFKGLVEQQRKLFDDELLENNPLETFTDNLAMEIDVAKAAEKKMSNYQVQKLSEVVTWESEEGTFAKIIASYTMTGKERTKTYQEFLLREDEKERWKIVGWRLTDPVEIED